MRHAMAKGNASNGNREAAAGLTGAAQCLFASAMRRFPSAILFWLALSLSAWAQYKDQTPAGEAPGPWIFGTIGVGRTADPKVPKTTALKGVALKLGENGEAGIAYDLDLCRVAGVWTGGKFVTPMNLMSRGEYPTTLGEVQATTREIAGFQTGPFPPDTEMKPWSDPRSEPFGPLPEVRYRGMYIRGARLILRWEADGVEILESPSEKTIEEAHVFTRALRLAAHPKAIVVPVCALPDRSELADLVTEDQAEWTTGNTQVRALWNLEDGVCLWKVVDGQLCLEIPASPQPATVAINLAFSPKAGGKLSHDTFYGVSKKLGLAPDLAELVRGKAPLAGTSLPSHRTGKGIETVGEVSTSKEAYVVDTVKLPDVNPWGAPMFLAGLDFFPDGRAAVCTFHGNVFIVSGLDAKLEHVTWKRFASGMYHPLGLKIVKGEIYVTERNGITRLRDLSGGGEADFYEAFNWDVKVTRSFHEFAFDLQTDSFGNFLFAKAGPVKNGGRGFDQIAEHHGSLFRVSPDGKSFSVVATGFRAPNGIGVGPQDQITTGDNEGTWTPACRLNWVNQGGFYGVVPLAHLPQPPTDYDKPLCWLPKRVDNSSGGQVWVTSDKWGPWQGRMLHLSYGTCALFGVLMEGVNVPDAPDCCAHVMQGGVTQFPLKFQSGLMRARFNPVDGQLYVVGLRGWQTTALKNGAFQRVRYTGEPARMPIELSAKKTGLELKFTCSLDTQQAADPENWSVEVWNYIWSGAYGSPEISAKAPLVQPAELGKDGEAQFAKAQMEERHHDVLTVRRVNVGTDDRTVFLEIPEIKPVMQMSIKYRIRSADGQELDGEVINTINALGEAP